MKKTQFLWVILGGALLALGFTQCSSGTGTLDIAACDAGPDVVCHPVSSGPPPSGW
jgi:hypothetical protein